MATFLLDSSAVIKRYRTESGSQVVAQLLANPPSTDRFYISYLTLLEFTSAIWRLVKGNRITETSADNVLSSFRADVRQLFRVWALDEEVVGSAINVAEQYRLRSGDAIQLATALILSRLQPRPQPVMVSADRELLEASNAAGLTVLDPVEEGAIHQLSIIRN
ncbi:MAG: type II toxin-antitoxin system VapC family toxin [SAR202 cluster bacterium]|jgi:predicted nucleic acid-binding protein|nr:hypothetical protein [Chloroflexota bacterium]MDP6420254.1 type II toxin-antitoxin system VapC family toxin [SAR202 cluster bacterium]HAL47776.1 hypothetical protein [Dehalococcoidia bacterium]MDP6664969.1 type II toxin-antitoxin system VapC family toxin [SAR202 cluster bacterium]MDP6798652.1 type II toxin-antitoxin system VapC family toxin [SAR202 cluster bacterium]|tara:strand:- start:10549 stop:11037 length:489 start_codon:yes stop_codon:yes gene_type:complete